MTPEERKGALVGLLGRLRTNAGSRLPSRSGDEEEFVPKSVIAARAAAAETAAAAFDASRRAALDDAMDLDTIEQATDATRPRFVPDDVPLETDPPPTAVPGSTPGTLEEALRQAEDAELQREHDRAAAESRMDSAPPTPRGELADEAPSIEMGDSSELELDLFDPFDDATATGAPEEIEADVLESAPPQPPPVPPARIAAQPPPAPQPLAAPPAPVPPAPPPQPPAPPASLMRAIPMRSSPTIESPAVASPPLAAATGPGPRKLVPPPSPSAPGLMGKPVPPPPRSSPQATAPVPPDAPAAVEPRVEQRRSVPPASRIEPASSKPLSIELPFDEQTEERNDVAAHAVADEVRIAEDDLEQTVNMPKRGVDPLAQTAQNPIPAAFERAVLRAEGAMVPPLESRGRDDAESPSAPPPPVDEAEEPVSSKQPLALDRDGDEVDDALFSAGDRADDGDEPPQSGEIASQRQPATGQHAPDLDLDGATPPSDQADAVAGEAMALLDAEAVPSAPPATRPAVMGRRPVAVTSFLDVLDDALSLAD